MINRENAQISACVWVCVVCGASDHISIWTWAHLSHDTWH